MRDIRGDLQDRASLLEEQISAHETQFEKVMEQITREHDLRLVDLKAQLEAVTRLMDVEVRRLDTVPTASTAKTHEPLHHALEQPAQHSDNQPPQHSVPQPLEHSVDQPVQYSSYGLQPQARTQPEQPLADFLVRKLNEVGAMSGDDLRRLALQEGYFVDADTADRGVNTTLLNVVKAGLLIRQLPNGNFAPATLLDTIRLRRAM
jgi:hypothetical protein